MPSKLQNELAQIGESKRGPICGVLAIKKQLDPDSSNSLDEALQSGKPVSAIALVLNENGYKVSDWTLRRHARGLCSCARSEKKSEK